MTDDAEDRCGIELGESTGGTDRLFVPLSSEPWYAFESGEKQAEFRGVNNQFNQETVYEGRTVELRRGYSTNDSLWGTVTGVAVGNHLGDLVEQYADELQYGGKSLGEVSYSANQYVGDYDEYIVFSVSLDRNIETGKDYENE